MRMTYHADFIWGLLGLLNPFALLAGLVSTAMLITHGAAWLTIKIEKGAVRDRAAKIGAYAALATLVLYALAGVWLYLGVNGYRITTPVDAAMLPNPLRKEVVVEHGAWLANYARYPWMVIAPVLGLAGALVAFIGLRAKSALGMVGSSLAIAGVILSVGASMFPFILPSSIDPRSSLTVWDSSSSHFTLFLMLVMALIFVPIVLFYTAWVYKVLWGRVTTSEATGANGEHAY
jgi:cytochrome d ubiquinol oxidase subunit II